MHPLAIFTFTLEIFALEATRSNITHKMAAGHNDEGLDDRDVLWIRKPDEVGLSVRGEAEIRREREVEKRRQRAEIAVEAFSNLVDTELELENAAADFFENHHRCACCHG